jgi:hypothetical protein
LIAVAAQLETVRLQLLPHGVRGLARMLKAHQGAMFERHATITYNEECVEYRTR